MSVRIQSEDFDMAAEMKALSESEEGQSPGAISVFSGLVRDYHGDKRITALTLEHYPEMTQKELERIRHEAMQRWALSKAVIIHRIGRLLPAEQIVFVGCAAAHREEAFNATQFIMDFLKTQAPFWKAEEIDGETRWVNAEASDEAAAARWLKNSD